MLDFVDELVEWVTDVPLLVVGTARPELLDPPSGLGRWEAQRDDRGALTPDGRADGDAHRRVCSHARVLADAQQKLIEHAGGNPLYAEQFAELYVERGSADDLPLPETLQGVIAARLDGLEGDEKELLQDAAVVGKVFWSGSLGREPETAVDHAPCTRAKGLRPARAAHVDRERERVRVCHALVRDVAYGQIPRAERAAKHRAVAEWIESLGRPDDHAEMLAYHWQSALELVRASGGTDARLEEQVRQSERAGRRSGRVPQRIRRRGSPLRRAPSSSRATTIPDASLQACRGARSTSATKARPQRSNVPGTRFWPAVTGRAPHRPRHSSHASTGIRGEHERCPRISGRQRPSSRSNSRHSASLEFSPGRPASRCSPVISETNAMHCDARRPPSRSPNRSADSTIFACTRSPPSAPPRQSWAIRAEGAISSSQWRSVDRRAPRWSSGALTNLGRRGRLLRRCPRAAPSAGIARGGRAVRRGQPCAIRSRESRSR